MRTTITLDPDVEALLRQAMRVQGRPFKQVINDAVRSALRCAGRCAAPVPAVQVRPWPPTRGPDQGLGAGRRAGRPGHAGALPLVRPDVNLLLCVVNADSPQQPSAARWLERGYADPAGMGFAWIALLGFIRIVTRPGIFPRPLTLDEALGQVDDWLNHPRAPAASDRPPCGGAGAIADPRRSRR